MNRAEADGNAVPGIDRSNAQLDSKLQPLRVGVVVDPIGKTVGRVTVQEGDELDGASEAVLQASRCLGDVDKAVLDHRGLRVQPGEALHPARESLATLAHIRQTIGEYNFAGQYQQSPAPLGGGLVKGAWFKRYGEEERSERFERIVQSWDTGNKATELSDFSVCTKGGSPAARNP
jgi:hypothetical protein